MREIKAVFFDIDGTLLNSHRTVSRSTIYAINQLKQKQIYVGVATGRDPRFILPYMASLGLDVAVAYNGQYIFARDTVLFSQSLSPSQVLAVQDYALKHRKELLMGLATGVVGSGLMKFGHGHLAYRISRFIPRSWAGLIRFLLNRILHRFVSKDRSEKMFSGKSVYQMMLVASEEEGKELVADFPDLYFTRSNSYSLDIISKGMSKLQGIREVCGQWGFDPDETVAFGDSKNDIEMLQGVGYAVAMGNADSDVKAVADLVTKSNDQDGISFALQKMGLITESEGERQ
ncbi:Hydrolase (HAD superfamily) [Streptococcus sp. DD13]|nr:Hydrolase (HAD superfamily) [Streptococcus sp. DD13]